MLVLDNSMFVSAIFGDEKHPFAVTLYQLILEDEEHVKVPYIFLYEACNVILISARRKRITEKNKQDYLKIIYSFPIQIDHNQPIQDVVKLASKHNLALYDALYLELAKRESLPLATFDNALLVAAKKGKDFYP